MNANNENINMDGWNAIVNAFQAIYPEKTDPKHYGTLIPYYLGGNDPLDGISIYDGGDFWHFVTFGLTELYDKESENTEYSGFGMEFTLKLKKGCYAPEDEETELKGICGILQSIARITFNSGELFRPYEYLYTGQKTVMDIHKKSQLTGFITIPDTSVKAMDTPNGKMEFVQLIGMTDAELLKLRNKETTVRELYSALNTDITDYHRNSIV